MVRIENLPCIRNHSFCEANVLLGRPLELGRVYDFRLRLRDTRGDTTTVRCTIRPTNSSTPIDTIFPHLPLLVVVPEVQLVTGRDTTPIEMSGLLVRTKLLRCQPLVGSIYESILTLFFSSRFSFLTSYFLFFLLFTSVFLSFQLYFFLSSDVLASPGVYLWQISNLLLPMFVIAVSFLCIVLTTRNFLWLEQVLVTRNIFSFLVLPN